MVVRPVRGWVLAALAAMAVTLGAQSATPGPPTYHLFFLGHEVGREVDTVTPAADGRQVQAAFHFDDRSSAIDLQATLEVDAKGAPRHLLVKGKTYRLFIADAEVTVTPGRAHVRDLAVERDLDLGDRPFFPVDNYAPVAVQEALIQCTDRARAAGGAGDRAGRTGPHSLARHERGARNGSRSRGSSGAPRMPGLITTAACRA